MASSLSGRVVVITGASSGIGRASARAFADEGAKLVLAARRQAALDEVVAECEARGAEAIAAPTDVSDPQSVDELATLAVRAFGRIDVWFNAAGVLHFGRVEETPARVISRVVETNLSGTIFGSQAAIRQFKQQKAGVLINTGSVLGVVGQPYAAAYVASKFAIRGLGEALRQETHHFPDIHVCTLSPAAIDTPAYQHAANYMGRELLPIRLLYPAEDVARACVALAKRPRREAFAGRAFGWLTNTGKTLAPGLSETLTAAAVRLMEVGQAPAAATEGSLFSATPDRFQTSGGWRERLGTVAAGEKVLRYLLVGAGVLTAGAAVTTMIAPRRRAA